MLKEFSVATVILFSSGLAAAQQQRSMAGDPMAGMQRPEPAQVAHLGDGVLVPMEYQLHLPVVRAFINEQGPYRFGFDSGASLQLSVSPELAEILALESAGEVMASDGTGQNQATRPLYQVDSLRIGEAVFSELVAMSGSYNRGPLGNEPIDGIIGIGLFNGLNLELDYPGEQLRISRNALPEPDGQEVFSIDPASPVPTMDWQLGELTVQTHIDARNMGAIMMPQSIAAELPLAGEPTVIGQARTQFNTIPISAAMLSSDLRFGRYVITAPNVTFAEIFRTANIGSRFMQQFVVTFDMKNNRVRFHREGDDPVELPSPRSRAVSDSKVAGSG